MEAVEPISPRAYELGAEYGLGVVEAEYRANGVSWGVILVCLVLGFPFSYLLWHRRRDPQTSLPHYPRRLSIW